MKRNVFVVGWGDRSGQVVNNARIVHKLKDAEIVVFTGGSDVNPKFYNQKPHSYTSCNTIRDESEIEAFHEAKALGIPQFGICRGAQLLTVLNGGTLIQHVTGHHGNHVMETYDGQMLTTTSCHHQMMYPYDLDESKYKLLAWSAERISKTYEGEEDQDHAMTKHLYPEPEMVVYFETKSLGVQGHPEWCIDRNPKFIKFINDCFDKYLFETALANGESLGARVISV